MTRIESELSRLSPRRRMRKLHLETRLRGQNVENIANQDLSFIKHDGPVVETKLPPVGNIFLRRNK